MSPEESESITQEAIWHASTEALYQTNKGGRVVRSNDAYLRLMNLSDGSVNDDSWLDLIADDYRATAEANFRSILTDHEYFSFPMEMKDGRCLQVIGWPIHDDDGEFNGYLGSVYDRTPVEVSQHRFMSAMFAMSVGILVMGVLMLLIWIGTQIWPYNQASIEQLTGVQSDEQTSDGIPVVREGEPIMYSVSFCNQGVDIEATRWLDSYGDSTIDVSELKEDGDLSRRSSSLLIRESIFYQDEPLNDDTTPGEGDNLIITREEATSSGLPQGCITNATVAVDLDLGTPTGLYYKLRTNNVYRPNIFASVNNQTETDLFYYDEPGEPIP